MEPAGEPPLHCASHGALLLLASMTAGSDFNILQSGSQAHPNLSMSIQHCTQEYRNIIIASRGYKEPGFAFVFSVSLRIATPTSARGTTRYGRNNIPPGSCKKL